MLIGVHVLIHSARPEKDRAFLRDVLGLPHIDAGNGRLMFGLPPSEVAIHPAKENDVHEFYLMCADVEAFVQAMGRRRVRCSAVQEMGWGRLVQLPLPGGGKLGVYEPRHGRPASMRVAKKAGRKAGAAKKKSARSRTGRK